MFITHWQSFITQSSSSHSSAILVRGEEDNASALVQGSRKLAYVPSISTTQNFFYRRHWVTVNRYRENTGYYNRPEERLTIRIMTRHHSFLDALLLEAKKEYMTVQENTISIYVSDSRDDWRHVGSRPKRPLNSIVLDPGAKDFLIEDARDFLASKPWYSKRGIPFRRGYLLYGPPGSGKTSIIHSLAGELGLDVYIISLSRSGMDDASLSELISQLPEKCIALMEDIDAAFNQIINRDEDDKKESSSTENPSGPKPSTSRVTLSGLLNALDGIGAQEGRILFATTNKYQSLDPALCRPGRMDVHIEFKLASKFQACELFRCFYLPEDDDDDTPVDGSEDSVTTADCSNDPALIDFDAHSDSSTLVSSMEPSSVDSQSPDKAIMHGFSHLERAPKLTRTNVLELARQFAEAVPERALSMASLQGYLMTYKTRPFHAVKDISDWVESERSKALPSPPLEIQSSP
ncbi:hypothetical protein H0H92_006459 [Tricholoma furcatifolium]|nr:hypothetical protein H0H92_006459 [Tricholoma furcatifolium]